ncbi:hypothetical protein ACET92_02990 [Aeromonas veronii]
MKLLNTYDDKDEAEEALTKLLGEKRLASERDSTVVIYNLFGQPTWGNFHRLGMFNLPELQMMLEQRKAGHTIDQARQREAALCGTILRTDHSPTLAVKKAGKSGLHFLRFTLQIQHYQTSACTHNTKQPFF